MVGFNAKDAARKLYAPKAILKRQSPCPQARSSEGHGLGVSMNVYAISDLEQKVEAVTKLEAEVTRSESAEFQRLELPEIDGLEGSGKKTE